MTDSVPGNLPDLSPEEWARARTLFDQAVGLPVDDRTPYLDRRCGGDRRLHQVVESLLEADVAPQRILDASLGELAWLLQDEEDAPEVHAGDRVGRYRVVAEIGRGGMGVVYQAEDPLLERFVALKFLPGAPGDAERVGQLLAEARTLAALDHPNIAAVHEIDVTPNGRWFMAMAYYEGETLTQRLQRGPLPRGEAARIAIGIARGLAAAHQHGVVHRDVKPNNVVLRKDGEPMLVDFGIASLGGVEGNTGPARGTVAYMSPERVAGAAADARADVWALGVVLYEMLAGRRPFQGETTHEVLTRIRAADPPALPARAGRDLERVVRRALARDPPDRFSDARQMLQRLESCSALRRRRGRAATVVAALGLTGAVLFGLKARSTGDDTAPEVATRSTAAYRLYVEGLRRSAQGAAEAAYASFVRALREDPTFAMAAFHAWRVSERDSILEVARALARRAPERERLFILGGIEAGLRSLAAAGYADSLTARYPGEPSAHLLAAELLHARGDYAAAIGKARIAANLASGTRPSPLRQWQERRAARLVVTSHWWMDSLAAAEREARRILALDPGDQGMAGDLAALLDRQGRVAEARSLLTTLRSQRLGRHAWAVELALLAIRGGDLDHAERELATLSRTLDEEGRGWARHYRFIALRNQGRLAAGLAMALEGRLPEDHGLEVTSGGAGTVGEGIARFEVGEWDRAAAIFDSLAAAAPENRPDRNAWWLTHAATAVAAAGDTARLAWLADSIESYGARSLFGRDQRLHHYARGLLEVARRRDEAAARHFRAAIVSPNEGFTRVNYELGRALLRLGRPAEAVSIVSAALRGSLDASNLYITHGELHELLAQAFDAAGQRDSARAHYRWVVDAWARADPEVRPRRAEAARRLAALGG